MICTLNKNKKQLNSGFSLIEIMIAIAIIGLIAGVGIPTYMRFQRQAKITTTKASLDAIKQAIMDYKEDTGKYPQDLEDLIERPSDVKKWRGPYFADKQGNPIAKLPKDGWNQDFEYELTGDKRSPYKVYSVELEEEESGSDE